MTAQRSTRQPPSSARQAKAAARPPVDGEAAAALPVGSPDEGRAGHGTPATPEAAGGGKPLTKSARQARVAELIEDGQVANQADLAARLAEEGVQVSQGTLSKDLLDLGAVRARTGSGEFKYVLVDAEPVGPSAELRLAKLCGELLLSAEASANLVVVRTPPGAAQFFASALDKASRSSILGTIAGDDTVVLITRDATGGQAVADALLGLARS